MVEKFSYFTITQNLSNTLKQKFNGTTRENYRPIEYKKIF